MDNSRTILSGTEEGVNITATNGDTERAITSTLAFDPTRPFFSAMYICVATNPVDSAEINATLTVHGKREEEREGGGEDQEEEEREGGERRGWGRGGEERGR